MYKNRSVCYELGRIYPLVNRAHKTLFLDHKVILMHKILSMVEYFLYSTGWCGNLALMAMLSKACFNSEDARFCGSFWDFECQK